MSVIVAPEPPEVVSPVMSGVDVVDQVYVAPVTLLVNETLAATPEQIVCEFGVAVATGDAGFVKTTL